MERVKSNLREKYVSNKGQVNVFYSKKGITGNQTGHQGACRRCIGRGMAYGSRARGDYDLWSDTDVAVIVRGLTKKMKNEIFNKVAEVECKYWTPLSILVLSEDEYENLKKRERRLALDIEKEGITI